MKNVASQSKLKQKLFFHALKVARERNERLEYLGNQSALPVSSMKRVYLSDWWVDVQFKLLDAIVLKKVRERFGGRLKYAAAGGAAVNLPVLHFFEDIGIPIMEGYGLTETSPMITAGTLEWEKRRLGCVGTALDGVDLRIVNPETLDDLPPDTDGEVRSMRQAESSPPTAMAVYMCVYM